MGKNVRILEDHKLKEFKRPGTNNPNLWQKRDGRWVMPEKQSRFLDWLLTPAADREHQYIKDWCAANGVDSHTPADWKRDRRFRREWEDRANAKNIGVERMQNVIDTLYEAAVDGDVQAAKLYIQEVEKLRPPRQVEADRDIEHLSDEELEAEIMELLSVEEVRTREDIEGTEGLGQAEGGQGPEAAGAAARD